MSRPLLEVADLIRTAGSAFIEHNRQWLRWPHIKVLLAIARCRTSALGGQHPKRFLLMTFSRFTHDPPVRGMRTRKDLAKPRKNSALSNLSGIKD
jgi:hypothetical protein